MEEFINSNLVKFNLRTKKFIILISNLFSDQTTTAQVHEKLVEITLFQTIQQDFRAIFPKFVERKINVHIF